MLNKHITALVTQENVTLSQQNSVGTRPNLFSGTKFALYEVECNF